MVIRNYKNTDFEYVAQWWAAADEPTPPPGCMPPNSTFVVEHDGRPVMSLSVLLTNTPEISYLEFFVADPMFKGEARKQAAPMLVEHCCKFARELGYKRAICFADCEPLVHRYKELGMRQTTEGLASFVRELR